MKSGTASRTGEMRSGRLPGPCKHLNVSGVLDMSSLLDTAHRVKRP